MHAQTARDLSQSKIEGGGGGASSAIHVFEVSNDSNTHVPRAFSFGHRLDLRPLVSELDFVIVQNLGDLH